MKNSIIRRVIFSLRSKARFLMIAIKKPSSLVSENYFEPFWGRFWSDLYYQVSGVKSKYYMSEPFFYNKWEKKTNDFSIARYFEHKGYLKNTLGSNTIPLIANCINGQVYNDDSLPICIDSIESFLKSEPSNSEFVIKISVGTGGGKGIEIGPAKAIIDVMHTYYNQGLDFLIQPRIDQHEDLKKYNPSSLNTVRIMTLRYKGAIRIVSTVLRMGNGGKVDNSAAGGISIGVNNSGKLNSYAIDHDFNKYYKHPSSKVSFSGDNRVPFFDDLKELVKCKHNLLKSHDIVSWDLSVDHDGNIIVIEYNVLWSEINFHQANNGPVFEPFKDLIEH